MKANDVTRATLVDDVAARAESAASGDDPPGVADFVRRGFDEVSAEDLEQRSPEYLAAAARAHWRLAAMRRRGTTVVRVFNPSLGADGFESPHTIVQIVTDDMPFLVESITMEIDRHELGVHLVVHPQVRVHRDADGSLLGVADADDTDAAVESFISAEIDRETDLEELERLRADLVRVLGDVRATDDDWDAMRGAMRHVADGLVPERFPLPADEINEGRALLEWMLDDHFTFIGYRAYDLVSANGADSLCSVAGTGRGVLRNAPDRSRSFATLPPAVRARARERTLLVMTKTNSRATVHRPTYLDYVGVKRFDERGEIIGEHRFLGLFTASAYSEHATEIPILRRKIGEIVRRAGFLPESHDERRLFSILESYPRDELFQAPVDELFTTVLGILRLQERRRVRLFARRDIYDRFVTCLVFVPRDRYTTAMRLRIADLLSSAYGAVGFEWSAMVTESVLARLHFTLHTDPNDHHEVDVDDLERRIAATSRVFTDDLRDALIRAAHGEERGLERLRAWARAFPVTYQESVPAHLAVDDITLIEGLTDDRAALAARLDPGPDSTLVLTLAGSGPAPTLSTVLPRLVNMGVTIVDEYPFTIAAPDRDPVWLKRIGMHTRTDVDASRGPAARSFEDAYLAVSRGDAEDDGFNRLVLLAGLAWREVAVVRAYCKYLRQAGTLYSQSYIEDALAEHAAIARRLVELFVARLDPRGGPAAQHDTAALAEQITSAIDDVSNLDHDRILRSVFHLVVGTLRTNWFRRDAAGGWLPSIAIKLDPHQVPDLPEPRPMFEVFVCSPRLEGVHLRGGRVARGGIRWSDRREDFRTEILGLMKAQMVKNAVIVPVGAKGGFVVKRPPGEPAELRAEGLTCYRAFIDGLLDITDNIVEGAVVAPDDVVRYDADDPYLVVAADKGTAAFSDVANELAVARGFWLGDAFAAGGSSGYDHKEIGITARGAWESVRHHFRYLGVDVDTSEITVVGIGDMSGDVFGNGMLLSRHLRLVAAFDHRHLFLDPDPDPEASFAERERLFRLAGSTWADYASERISAGGGVYARSAKSIPISPQVRARFAISEPVSDLTPAEFVRAILRAPVDMLWSGGIGTFVKARRERHSDVGDKGNDAVRVDAIELRCKVIAEGGNLGLTQLARVEFALAGGLVNTDAIDNSAGVDASDHEVNIKIALDTAIRAGHVPREERDALLVGMTADVAALVLRDNYRQNRALANARSQAAPMIDVHARYVRSLVEHGELDRDLEFLPDDEGFADRRNAGLGLTGPELAVLMAYAKITLAEALVDTDFPDDPDLRGELVRYFPPRLSERCEEPIAAHPLRREIVVTTVVNGLVNRAGISSVFRLGEETGAPTTDIVRAHEIARAVFDEDGLWHEIEGLDGVVAATTQTDMYLESRKLVERGSRWFLRNRKLPIPITATIEHFRNRVARVGAVLPDVLRGTEREWLQSATADFAARGVPRALATRVALLDSWYTSLDIVDLAESTGRAVEDVAALHAAVGDRLRLDWLRDQVVDLPRGDRWQSLSRLALREDTHAVHKGVVAAILATSGEHLDADAAYDHWAAANTAGVARALETFDEIRAHGVLDLATLSVALREVRGLLPKEG